MSACGPPVDEPISSTRGGVNGIGRSDTRCGAASSAGDAEQSTVRVWFNVRRGFSGQRSASRKPSGDLPISRGGRRRRADLAIASWFLECNRGAERQRLQADLGVPPGQRRGHDHDQIWLLAEQQRQRGDAVEFRHVDVEHDHVGIGALDLRDGIAAGAQRGDDFKIGFGFDPTREQPAHDHRVVNDHDPDAPADGGVGGLYWHVYVHWT